MDEEPGNVDERITRVNKLVKITVTLAKEQYITGFHDFDNMHEAIEFINEVPGDRQWQMQIFTEFEKTYRSYGDQNYDSQVTMKGVGYRGNYYD